MRAAFCRPILLLVFTAFAGCSTPVQNPVQAIPTIAQITYNTAVDERTTGSIFSDKDLVLRIKQALMHKDAKAGFFLNIYAFNSHVFLIGDPKDEFVDVAIKTTAQQRGVEALTYCFFSHNSGNAFNDYFTGMNLRSKFFLTPDIHSSWVDFEVYAGNAVLVGVMPDKEAKAKVESVANESSGVLKVISFLLLKKPDDKAN